jgi:glutamate/aspartate transport system substrate-binding protein
MDGNILAGLIAKSKSPEGLQDRRRVLNVEPIAIMIRKDDPPSRRPWTTASRP